nr:hypothetical protein [Tanacetum cinerariifolium]
MKHWKSGFFLIDRRAISDSMVWIHPDAAIDDPRPAVGSFSVANVHWLIMGIYDFLCLSEWTDVEVQEEPYLDDLTIGTPSDSDDESDGDDDACVEIPLVTPLCSAAMIPSSRNEGRSSNALAGKCIMADDVIAPSVGASRPRPSSGPSPSLRDVFGDTIHADFFPFSAGPYYATYPQDGVARNYEFTCEEWDAPYRPTFGVRTKEIFKDPVLNVKMSVLHCMMMSHGGEILASYHGLVQSHHEYVQSADSRLKGYEERVAGVAGLELQVSILKKHVSGLHDKLVSYDASFAKSKAKGKERKKKIKSLTKSLDNLHAEVARLSAALNQATVLEAEKDEEILRLKETPLKFASFFCDLIGLLKPPPPLVVQTDYTFLNKISKHASEPLSVIFQFEPENFARPANILTSRDPRVSPLITKESTVTHASKSLELSTNADLTPSVVASKHDDEMVNAKVDGMLWELVVLGSGCASSCPNDVVVTLSAGKKGDGLVPSSAAREDATANPLGV